LEWQALIVFNVTDTINPTAKHILEDSDEEGSTKCPVALDDTIETKKFMDSFFCELKP
jgi:hypothetical protein